RFITRKIAPSNWSIAHDLRCNPSPIPKPAGRWTRWQSSSLRGRCERTTSGRSKMVQRFSIGILLLMSLALAQSTQPTSLGLRDPAKKEIAMELVSTAENSSLDWKAQYGYIEYNVEHNDKENRGYTAGIIGFTSRTHDMLELVGYYQKIAPDNPLTTYL